MTYPQEQQKKRKEAKNTSMKRYRSGDGRIEEQEGTAKKREEKTGRSEKDTNIERGAINQHERASAGRKAGRGGPVNWEMCWGGEG